MSDSWMRLLIVVAVVWLAIGLVLSLVMGRRGHSHFGWLVLGALLGPLAIVLAIDSKRHGEDLAPQAVATAAGSALPGPVDVVVGYDGSVESVAAIEAVTRLLGDRLGRLTLATVVSFDGGKESERLARAQLERMAAEAGPATPRIDDYEVLHGRPAEALRLWAAQEGYDLIAVGARGAGLSKRLLGSAAQELARGSKVPVLVVGAQ